MRMGAIAAALLMVLVGCSAGEKKVPLVEVGQVKADNVIIDHNGRAKAEGPMAFALGEPDPKTGEMLFTGRLGPPQLAGPKIVYVYKTIDPESLKIFREEKIEVMENAAYMLPEGVKPSRDALRGMTLIGRIDPTMSDDEIVALFGVSIPEPQYVPAPE